MSGDVGQDGCEAYRLFGTPDEFRFEAMVDTLRLQHWAHDCPEDMPDEYREWSLGITAWEVIGFALERGWPIPEEALAYLQQVAKSVDDWAVTNGHPGELKGILKLHGKRKSIDEKNDPRWMYAFIAQMKANDPKRSIKSLVQEFLKQHPELGYSEEAVRQKYYEGKKLVETGSDYKGRDRKTDLRTSPTVAASDNEIDF